MQKLALVILSLLAGPLFGLDGSRNVPRTKIAVTPGEGSGIFNINHENANGGVVATTSVLKGDCSTSGVLKVTLTTNNLGKVIVSVGPNPISSCQNSLDITANTGTDVTVTTSNEDAANCGRSLEPGDGITYSWQVKVEEEVNFDSTISDIYTSEVKFFCAGKLIESVVTHAPELNTAPTQSGTIDQNVPFELSEDPASGSLWKFTFKPSNPAQLGGKLFGIESCLASPATDSTLKKELIIGGCIKDSRTTVVTDEDGYLIQVPSFRFKGKPNDPVLVQCIPKFCAAGATAETCTPTSCAAKGTRNTFRNRRSLAQVFPRASVVVHN